MPILGLFKDRSMFFDLPRGWHQMIDTPTVLWSGIAIAISISLFNFFGLSVTRHGVCSFSRLNITVELYLIGLSVLWVAFVWIVSLGDCPLAYRHMPYA